jgi:hypothetical protein
MYNQSNAIICLKCKVKFIILKIKLYLTYLKHLNILKTGQGFFFNFVV